MTSSPGTTPNARRPISMAVVPLVHVTPHAAPWKSARSEHSGGVNVAFVDGHVAFIKDTINPMTWRALATRGGGEVISSDSH